VNDVRSQTIRVIVVDDDPFARQRLRLLADSEADVEIVRECVDGREAVEALSDERIDLVFLDVEMPRLDGFGVVREIGVNRMPPVIFTSAYSEFAVRAFEAYALDYLLKPFDDTRFAAAVARARTEISARRARTAAPVADSADSAPLDPRLLGLLDHLRRPVEVSYPEAIAIRAGGQYVVIRTADIDWIEADGNYARVYVDQKPRLLTKSLATLEKEVLDPDIFVRVHRSAIVNTTKITAAETLFHGELSLVLRDNTRVQCSRRFRKHLEERLYFTT
jgi:two-component system LytT family response regulator